MLRTCEIISRSSFSLLSIRSCEISICARMVFLICSNLLRIFRCILLKSFSDFLSTSFKARSTLSPDPSMTEPISCFNLLFGSSMMSLWSCWDMCRPAALTSLEAIGVKARRPNPPRAGIPTEMSVAEPTAQVAEDINKELSLDILNVLWWSIILFTVFGKASSTCSRALPTRCLMFRFQVSSSLDNCVSTLRTASTCLSSFARKASTSSCATASRSPSKPASVMACCTSMGRAFFTLSLERTLSTSLRTSFFVSSTRECTWSRMRSSSLSNKFAT
mmetsp:Transcript_19993/g.38561  ORF Transcript_19993/g.38561 Transcript_19993/m.38561 type:complete len:276 (+) Transcript_19993:258-1085(+)